jgi:hypothetical protein
MLPDRLRLPLTFDPAALQRDLAALGGTDWIAHFVTQNYSGDWSVLPLRGKAGATHPVMMIYSDPGCTEFADTPFLDACPYYKEVLAAFQCPLQCVRLMRLTPGSIIKEHCDHDLAPEFGTVRLHLPVTTDPGVDFRLNGTRVIMQPGELWYLRLAQRPPPRRERPHSPRPGRDGQRLAHRSAGNHRGGVSLSVSPARSSAGAVFAHLALFQEMRGQRGWGWVLRRGCYMVERVEPVVPVECGGVFQDARLSCAND